MMDIKRFELTEDMRDYIIKAISTPVSGISQVVSMVVLHFDIPEKEADRLVVDAIYKTLSHFEPVELEALGDEEIKAEYESWADLSPDDEYQMKGLRGITLQTIQHNQSKGQLYRLREGE